MIDDLNHFVDSRKIIGHAYGLQAYAEGRDWITALFTLNPLYCFITVARWTMMGGDAVTPGVILSIIVWTTVLFVAGFIWFRAGEQEYARD